MLIVGGWRHCIIHSLSGHLRNDSWAFTWLVFWAECEKAAKTPFSCSQSCGPGAEGTEAYMLQSEVAVMKEEELEGGDFRHGVQPPVRDPSTGTAGELHAAPGIVPLTLLKACQATGCGPEIMERFDGATVQTTLSQGWDSPLHRWPCLLIPYLILDTVINILLMAINCGKF